MTERGEGLEPLARTIRSRRMVRTFTDDDVDVAVLDELLDLARRAPSAGNTQPWELLVLAGEDIEQYWETTLGERRTTFRWQGLFRAPVLVLPYVRPDSYAERYAEPDKAGTGLGDSPEAWAVPYWWVDAGAMVQNLLLAVTAARLGACFFGQFAHEAALRERFGVPDDRRAVGTIAIGHPAPGQPGRSADRPRPSLGDVVHRGRW